MVQFFNQRLTFYIGFAPDVELTKLFNLLSIFVGKLQCFFVAYFKNCFEQFTRDEISVNDASYVTSKSYKKFESFFYCLPKITKWSRCRREFRKSGISKNPKAIPEMPGVSANA